MFKGTDDQTQKRRITVFFQNDISIADPQTITLNDIKIDFQSNRTFQDVFKRIQSSDCRQCSEAESPFKKEAETLTTREGMGKNFSVKSFAFLQRVLSVSKRMKNPLPRVIFETFWKTFRPNLIRKLSDLLV